MDEIKVDTEKEPEKKGENGETHEDEDEKKPNDVKKKAVSKKDVCVFSRPFSQNKLLNVSSFYIYFNPGK